METLLSILDDAAAVGNKDKLRKLGNRWRRRASRWDSVRCNHIADAAHWRMLAIANRQGGMIQIAKDQETRSEHAAKIAAKRQELAPVFASGMIYDAHEVG